MDNEKRSNDVTEGEIGFIALKIKSENENKNVGDINANSARKVKLINIIEEQLDLEIDKSSIDYTRLIRHLRYAIERMVRGEKVNEPLKITDVLKVEYPVCYNLAWKLIKVMQQSLQKDVQDAEAVYLTLHLQRLHSKKQS